MHRKDPCSGVARARGDRRRGGRPTRWLAPQSFSSACARARSVLPDPLTPLPRAARCSNRLLCDLTVCLPPHVGSYLVAAVRRCKGGDIGGLRHYPSRLLMRCAHSVVPDPLTPAAAAALCRRAQAAYRRLGAHHGGQHQAFERAERSKAAEIRCSCNAPFLSLTGSLSGGHFPAELLLLFFAAALR